MDFIASLLVHQGQTVILVVIDRFSEAAHFGTLPIFFPRAKQQSF